MTTCKECLNNFILIFDRDKKPDVCDWCFYIDDGRNIKEESKIEQICAESFNLNKKIRKDKKRCPVSKRVLPVGMYYEKNSHSFAGGGHGIYIRVSIKRFGAKQAYAYAKEFRSRLRKMETPDLAYYEAQKVYKELGFTPLKKKINDSLPNKVRYLPNSKVSGTYKKVLKVVHNKKFIKMFIVYNESDLIKAFKEIQKILIFIEQNPTLDPKEVYEKFKNKKYPKCIHREYPYLKLRVDRCQVSINKRIPIKLFGEKMAIILAKNVIKQSEKIEDMELKKKFIYEAIDKAIELKKRENGKAKL